MSTVSTIQNLLELVADGNKQLIDRFGAPFRLGNNTPEDIANTAIETATGSRLDKRNSNTFFRNLGEFQDKTGIVLADTPKSIKITSPIIPALRGNSSVNALFPQNKLIYEYNNQFDPNTIVTPALLHDGKQSLLFAPTGRADENSLRPLKRLTDQEHVGRVLDNVSRIMADPTIPERAKSVLASTIGSDVYGGFSSNKDGSLNINYDKLTGFLAALTDDQPFRQSLGEEGGRLWDLRRQFSTLDKLDKTVNNPYYRSYRGENGSAPVLLGYTFGVDPDGSVRSMHNIAQKKGDTPKPVYFSGIKANLDQKSIKKQSDIRDKINEGYKEVPVDNNLYLDSERVSNQGAYDSNTKSIIGQGNLLFTNQQLPRSEALRLQKEYVRSLENAVNSHLYQSMGKVEKPILAGEKVNGGVKISSDTTKSVRNTGLSQLTNDAEVGTIGYITKPIAGKDGTVRNAKRLAVKMNGGIQEGRVAIKGKDVVFSAGTSGNTVTIPLGQINVKTNQLGEEVVELPSILNQITGGRVKYNPEEINTLEVTPSFREGEDKLQALARIATMDIPSGGEVVQFPVPFKRFSEETDNFLKTSLGSDDQSQLLARALNFADPNRTFAKQLGVDVIPDSRWNEALKIKPVEGITSTAILPISRDVQQSTGKDWAELYAQQMVGADGSVLPSIVVPYNPSQGNDLLKESVEQAYQNLTGNKAEIQFTEDIDGVPIGYLGQKPSQVRYFPTTETWQERGRKPVTNPKSLKRSIAGWLGGNDQYIKEAEIVAPQNTLISPEDLAGRIARSDKTMGGYASTDSPVVLSTLMPDYFNDGRFARRESLPVTSDMIAKGMAYGNTRYADIDIPVDADMRSNKIGQPNSNFSYQLAATLKALADPKYNQAFGDAVPYHPVVGRFANAMASGNDIVVEPDEINWLRNIVEENQLSGYGNSILPLDLITEEASGILPDNYPRSINPDGSIAVRNGVPVDYSPFTKLRPVQGSAAVRTGKRLVDNRQVTINPEEFLIGADDRIRTLGNLINSERDPALRRKYMGELNLLNQQVTDLNTKLNNEMMFDANTSLPAVELYQQLADNFRLPVMSDPRSIASIRNKDTSARQVTFSNSQVPYNITKTSPVWIAPDGSTTKEVVPTLYRTNNLVPNKYDASVFANADISVDPNVHPSYMPSINYQGSINDYYNPGMVNHASPATVIFPDDVTTQVSGAIPQTNYKIIDVNEQKELVPIKLSADATPEEKAVALQLANRNLKAQQINQARRSIAQARASDEELRAIIQVNWEQYGIPPEKTIRDFEKAGFYQDQSDVLARHKQIRAEIEAGVRPNPDKRLEGLNLNEQSINLLNDYLPSEQRIQMSDISSTNDPWQTNYEQSTGWSDSGIIEPSVMPVEIMPDNKIYSERYGVGADPQYIIQGENGTKYIYVPDDIQQKLQDDYDLAALRERQTIADNLRFVQNEPFNPQLTNILDEVDRTSVRPDVTEQPTPAWQQIVAEQIAPYTPEGRRRAMEAQVIASTNNTTQSAGVRPEVLEVNNSSRNTSSATPTSAAIRTNQLTPEQQKMLLLGLGGLGAYGVYDAVNQPQQQQSYAVRVA